MDPSTLDEVNPYIYYVVFIATVTIETFVFISLRFKIDKAALIIALAYLIVMIIRMVP